MGAAYDYMCKSESLENTLNNRNRKIREQKKLIIELCEGILRMVDTKNSLHIKAFLTLNKLNNKNKK